MAIPFVCVFKHHMEGHMATCYWLFERKKNESWDPTLGLKRLEGILWCLCSAQSILYPFLLGRMKSPVQQAFTAWDRMGRLISPLFHITASSMISNRLLHATWNVTFWKTLTAVKIFSLGGFTAWLLFCISESAFEARREMEVFSYTSYPISFKLYNPEFTGWYNCPSLLPGTS